MTLEQCQARLAELRSRQGTPRPKVRVVFRGTTFQGLVVYSDSDFAQLEKSGSPYGVLVIERLGLVPGPATIVQIASIGEDGLEGLDQG